MELIQPGKPPLLPRILNLQRSQLCYIVGTVYLDMPLKPNVLEDLARDVRRATPCRGTARMLMGSIG
jgi:DNA polymerase delta subunit 2